MKVQTAVLLLCFLSGVFLSVVQAKPSPALMRELIALEKYLEKKEGSEGTDVQDQNPGEKPTENKPVENEKGKPENENNNNGETITEEGSGSGPEADKNKILTGEVDSPVKPENAPSKTAEEALNPFENMENPANEDGGFPASVGDMNVDLSPGENPLVGQVKNERDKIYTVLDEVIRTIKDALDKLSTLGNSIREQFKNDDRKITGLEDNTNKAKKNTIEKIDQLKTLLEELQKSLNGKDEMSLVGEKSVQENAPARRSHISDTEFVNMLHSLLAYS